MRNNNRQDVRLCHEFSTFHSCPLAGDIDTRLRRCQRSSAMRRCRENNCHVDSCINKGISTPSAATVGRLRSFPPQHSPSSGTRCTLPHSHGDPPELCGSRGAGSDFAGHAKQPLAPASCQARRPGVRAAAWLSSWGEDAGHKAGPSPLPPHPLAFIAVVPAKQTGRSHAQDVGRHPTTHKCAGGARSDRVRRKAGSTTLVRHHRR